ncbi:Uncharacterised protein [Vibrio cholerae]|nr:Uncharacterised protein [Vibrio cholerae]
MHFLPRVCAKRWRMSSLNLLTPSLTCCGQIICALSRA